MSCRQVQGRDPGSPQVTFILMLKLLLVLCTAGKVDLCKITREVAGTREALDCPKGLVPHPAPLTAGRNGFVYLVPPLTT